MKLNGRVVKRANAFALRVSCVGLSVLMAYSTGASGFNYLARLTPSSVPAGSVP
ncbi:MAG: hypothetical protein IH944_04630 [Armatimonadetes bacterium]|nr:hypothetical protein [Armatimonadota bacterium]